MSTSVFDHKDYKRYLGEYISVQPKGGRGVRRQFAEAAGCQVAYVSQVLNGHYDFSPEQAEAISRHIGHSREESEFFVLLIELARAGTKSLRLFFQRMLAEKLEKHLLLRNRAKISKSLSPADQALYYSKWYYSAIHMILTIPEYRSASQISEYLALPISAVREALELFERTGLASSERGVYQLKGNFLYLDKHSPLIVQHHSNWRTRAAASLAIERENDLHYSSCFTISVDDATKLRSLLAKSVENATELIKPSKEEKLFAFCLDLFEV